MRNIFAISAIGLTLSACQTVQPDIPVELQANAVTLPIKGANGLRGTLRTQTLNGREVAARYGGYGQAVTFFGVAEKRKFKTRFTVDVPGDARVEADCRADVQNQTLNAVGVSIQTVPMTYGCTFVREGNVIGYLDLSELTEDRVSARDAWLVYEDREILVVSEHRDTVSGLTLAYPVAYTFLTAGQPIATVNVAGDRALVLSESMDATTEAGVRLGAIALSLLSDPSTN